MRKTRTDMMKKTDFKLHILYEFRDDPWGGGNQFLKGLRQYFRKKDGYTESPEDADVILCNSHHCLDTAVKIKRAYPNKIFVHRVGPVFRLARVDKMLDAFIYQFNKDFADGTIFQSEWSKEKNHEFGMETSKYETVILNASDPKIFNSAHKKPFTGKRTRLVSTSWSGNIKKGFDIYGFLDEHLDFSKYEMTFVGNSPINFRNIQHIPPLSTQELAEILREHDIYIAASRDDACSNSLIEALHCGLPAVARNDSGHPEIIGRAGDLFEDEEGVIPAIEAVAQNYRYYQQQIDLPSLEEVGRRYYEFIQHIQHGHLNGQYQPKRANSLAIMRFKWHRARASKQISLMALKAILNRATKAVPGRIVTDFYSKSLHRRLLEQEIKKINLTGLTLDIGSKNRRYDSYFPYANIVAIDIDPQLKDGSIIQCDARNLCFKDDEFDSIISFETLEYIYETERVLAEVKRVLKPGAVFYFSAPFMNPVHGDIDVIRYTRQGWEELLRRYFDKIEIKSLGGRYSVIFDFWFDRIRKSNEFVKLFLLPVIIVIKKTSLFWDKRDSAERFAMDYFVKAEK